MNAIDNGCLSLIISYLDFSEYLVAMRLISKKLLRFADRKTGMAWIIFKCIPARYFYKQENREKLNKLLDNFNIYFDYMFISTSETMGEKSLKHVKSLRLYILSDEKEVDKEEVDKETKLLEKIKNTSLNLRRLVLTTSSDDKINPGLFDIITQLSSLTSLTIKNLEMNENYLEMLSKSEMKLNK